MTKPTAPTESTGAKVFFPVKDGGAGSLLSAFIRALKRAVSSDAGEYLAAMQVGTHERGTTVAADDPVEVIAGLSDAGAATSPKVLTAAPAAADPGLVVRMPNAAGAAGVGGAVLVRAADGASCMDEPNDALKVSMVASSVPSGGAAQVDRSAFVDGTASMNPVGGVLNDTPTDPTEDQAAAVRITAKRGLHVNLRTNAGGEIGVSATPVRTDPTGTTTQPVSGTVTANLAAGANNIGDVDVLTLPSIPAGTARIGKVYVRGGDDVADADVLTADPGGAAKGLVTRVAGGLKSTGWDAGAMAVQRGLQVGITATTEQTLLAADASNLYNVLDIVVAAFAGTAVPGGVRYLSFRHGVAGTEFMRVYIPNLINEQMHREVHFQMPDRGAVNQAVTVQLNAALGASGEYSATVHAYKTSS